MIAKALRRFAVDIQTLKHDHMNVREHGDENIDAIKASLRQFGQQSPLVALKDGTVIIGNGRLSAALQMRWKQIAVVTFEGTAMEAKALAIADNRSAELATWNVKALGGQLKLADLKKFDIGFSADERMAIILKANTLDDEGKRLAPAAAASKESARLIQTCPKCAHKFTAPKKGKK